LAIRIVNALLSVIGATNSATAAGVRDIAADVGVGPTALYHYFESKQHCRR